MKMQRNSSSQPGQRRPISRVRSVLCLAVVTSVAFSLSVSQMPPQPNGGLPGNGRTSGGFPALPEDANPHPDGIRALQDSMMAHDYLKRMNELNALRQREMTSDTAKLLELATELKTATDKREKDQMMTSVQKVEQIEKLAHAVQQKMKATMGN